MQLWWRSIFGKISITSIRATVSDQFGCKFFLAGSQIHFCCVDKGKLSAPFFSTGVIGVSFFGRFRICIIEICRMIDFNFDYKTSSTSRWRHLHIKTTFQVAPLIPVRQRFLFSREIEPVFILDSPLITPMRQRFPFGGYRWRLARIGGYLYVSHTRWTDNSFHVFSQIAIWGGFWCWCLETKENYATTLPLSIDIFLRSLLS